MYQNDVGKGGSKILMKLMRQLFFLLGKNMGPISFLYIYIYYLRWIVMDTYATIGRL
jgi:hypothetical protein